MESQIYSRALEHVLVGLTFEFFYQRLWNPPQSYLYSSPQNTIAMMTGVSGWAMKGAGTTQQTGGATLMKSAVLAPAISAHYIIIGGAKTASAFRALTARK